MRWRSLDSECSFSMALRSTIHKEMERCQIAKARELIATTDLPLKQVAVMCGFVHVYYIDPRPYFTGTRVGRLPNTENTPNCNGENAL